MLFLFLDVILKLNSVTKISINVYLLYASMVD